MSHVPLPVRVAVGLMVTVVEQARKLPEQPAYLPVTAASRAVQVGMRVQQRVTELAIKGDQVFSLLRPVADTPPWARFDEDSQEDDQPQPPGTESTVGPGGESHKATDGVAAATVNPGPGTGHGAPVSTFGEVDEADVARALTPARPSVTSAKPEEAGSTPPVLPEYGELSLAQLRGKLRGLSLPQLTELLEYEHGHLDRAAFVTLLSNRISTVRAQ